MAEYQGPERRANGPSHAELARLIGDLRTEMKDLRAKTNELERSQTALGTTFSTFRKFEEIANERLGEIERRLGMGDERMRAIEESIKDLDKDLNHVKREILEKLDLQAQVTRIVYKDAAKTVGL